MKNIIFVHHELLPYHYHTTLLKDKGYNILTFNNHNELLKYIEKENNIDLVILPISFPGIDSNFDYGGITLYEKINPILKTQYMFFDTHNQDKISNLNIKLNYYDAMETSPYMLLKLIDKLLK